MLVGLVDGGLVLTFGALAAADGLSRAPARSVILARRLGGPWHASDQAPRAALRLTAPFTPLTSGIISRWAPEAPVTAAEFTARLDRCAGERRLLVVLGAVQLVGFVVGFPAAVAYWSGTGLIAALVANLSLSLVIAGVARLAMRRLGPSVGDGLGARLVRAMSPFSAAAASNDVLRSAAQQVPAVVAAEVLLAPEVFARWVRPFVWDHRQRAPDAVLKRSLGERGIAAVLAADPPRLDPTARAFCPRCAAEFAADGIACPSCDIAVRAFGGEAP